MKSGEYMCASLLPHDVLTLFLYSTRDWLYTRALTSPGDFLESFTATAVDLCSSGLIIPRRNCPAFQTLFHICVQCCSRTIYFIGKCEREIALQRNLHAGRGDDIELRGLWMTHTQYRCFGKQARQSLCHRCWLYSKDA